MLTRTLLCIPTYNNDQTIHKVIDNALSETSLPVLVVDDGSDTPITHAASERLKIIRFPTNQGKGFAIREAFRYAIENGFTHLVTMDGDGQHLVSEALRLVRAIDDSPWALLIGNRELTGESVPKITRFGRKFSNFWTEFETSKPVKDSQSGLRVYPLFHVQTLRFLTKRYDFEIEVLIRLLWKGVEVREIPVHVIYPPKEDRVSHFRKFRDNVRITILNFVLIAVSLCRYHLKTREIAIALGLGVFIGCTPLYGLHGFVVMLIAFLLRLNVPVMWLGSQISIPPFAPALFYLSLQIGNHFTHHVVASFALGSIILGAILGILLGAATYVWLSFLRSKHEKRAWSGRIRGGRFGNWFITGIAKYLGLRVAYFCLYFVVPYFYFCAPRGTKASLEYWKVVKPSANFMKRSWMVLCHYYRFGTLMLDRVFQGFFAEPKFITTSNGAENILRLRDSGRGFIFLTLHAGAWDIPAKYMVAKGLREGVHAFQHESAGETFEKVREKAHAEIESFKTVFANQRENPVMDIRDLLNAQKPVGLMADRPSGKHVELVIFLGKLAPFDVTPFRIAASLEVPVLLSFAFKDRGNRYQFYAFRPRSYCYTAGRDRSLQLLDWLQECVSDCEAMIRRYPDQWLNFFPFFSAVPV